MDNNILHIPVLAKEVITYLQLKKGMIIVDCTVGVGGHAADILKQIGDSGYLIGIDRDEEALEEARKHISCISDRFRLIHSNYKDVDAILAELNIYKVDGALFDLGISSFQMDRAARGFSIKLDGPLDMRMDKNDNIKASDIVNGCSKSELMTIFRKYADEYFAARIADRIIKERRKQHIGSTARLAGIVTDALPYRYRFRRIHPATKVFMALRIAVNNEIESLTRGLSTIIPFLSNGSRICVISFHSIEDRVVKNKFREFAGSRQLKIITKKPVRPNIEEINNNPKSRSAKLRVAEKVE
jgi:16S rRNA (cytosine1402-N4)-methyltransferase